LSGVFAALGRRPLAACALALWILTVALPACADDASDGLSAEGIARFGERGMGLFVSVFVHRDWVFASTPSGLFRASNREKKWTELPLPKHVPYLGLLATQPADSPLVYYFNAPKGTAWSLASTAGKTFGLYRCDLNGQKWELRSSRYEFTHIRIHRDGVMYGIARLPVEIPEDPDRPLDSDRILMSSDSGKSWSNISNKISPFLSLVNVVADPDHNDLVCVRACGKMGVFLYQAADKSYSWNKLPEREWNERHGYDDYFFVPDYFTGTTLFLNYATLSNYFDYPFGDRVAVPAFEISVGGHRKFKKDEQIILPVEVTFRNLPGEIATLVDSREGNFVWGLKRVLPDGKREIVDVARSDWGSPYTSPDGTHFIIPVRKPMRPSAVELRFHRLSNGKSYTRAINLSAMCDFSKPGKYRLQLIYENGAIADAKKGEWVGKFSGPVLEVTVTP
jgi:hypothetical protein